VAPVTQRCVDRPRRVADSIEQRCEEYGAVVARGISPHGCLQQHPVPRGRGAVDDKPTERG
jgi:hypothetical protein